MIKNSFIERRTFLLGLASLSTPALLSRALASASNSFAPFSFAVISNSHLVTGVPDSFKLTQESQLFLQDALKQINNLNLDFVLFAGDQVDSIGNDEINWQLFLDLAQSLNCPWYFVLGERDVSGTIPVDKMSTYGRDWKGRGLTNETTYWSQDVLPGVHLIGLDTSCANTTVGELNNEQLTWLKNDLNDHKGEFTIVLSHHPLLPPAPYDSGSPWNEYLLSQAAPAREILNSSPDVLLAISGHTYISKIEKEKNTWYVSCPGLNVYPCAFRVFHVDPEKITVETHQINYPALVKKAHTNLAESSMALHYNAKHPTAFLNIAEGSHTDQSARLPLN